MDLTDRELAWLRLKRDLTSKDAIKDIWIIRREAFDKLSAILFRSITYLILYPDYVSIKCDFPPNGEDLFEIMEKTVSLHGSDGFLKGNRKAELIKSKYDNLIPDNWNFNYDKDNNILELDMLVKVPTELKKKIPPDINFSVIGSFGILSSYCKDMLKLYDDASNFNLSVIKSEILKKNLWNFFLTLEWSADILTEISYELIGYWKGKLKQKEIGKPGGIGQKKKMEGRINEVKRKVESIAQKKDGNYEIEQSDWFRVLKESFGYDYIPVSPPTENKYKKLIEKWLSDEKGNHTEFKIKK